MEYKVWINGEWSEMSRFEISKVQRGNISMEIFYVVMNEINHDGVEVEIFGKWGSAGLFQLNGGIMEKYIQAKKLRHFARYKAKLRPMLSNL